MKTYPIVKTIKHAKALSLKKWHKARKDLEALLQHTSNACGFCHLYYGVEDLPGGCLICEVSDKCRELDGEVNNFLEGTLKYIEENLIPYIENFEPRGGSQ